MKKFLVIGNPIGKTFTGKSWVLDLIIAQSKYAFETEIIPEAEDKIEKRFLSAKKNKYLYRNSNWDGK